MADMDWLQEGIYFLLQKYSSWNTLGNHPAASSGKHLFGPCTNPSIEDFRRNAFRALYCVGHGYLSIRHGYDHFSDEFTGS